MKPRYVYMIIKDEVFALNEKDYAKFKRRNKKGTYQSFRYHYGTIKEVEAFIDGLSAVTYYQESLREED